MKKFRGPQEKNISTYGEIFGMEYAYKNVDK
jgi:hypothetical protein